MTQNEQCTGQRPSIPTASNGASHNKNDGARRYATDDTSQLKGQQRCQEDPFDTGYCVGTSHEELCGRGSQKVG